MATHTIEVTGISDDMLEALDERVRESGGDRAAFIPELMWKALQRGTEPSPASLRSHADMTFEEILTPVQKQVAQSGITDEELTQIFEEAREQVRRTKKAARTNR